MNIRKLTIDDLHLYKDIRLELLRMNPENFGSDASEEQAFEQKMWTKRLTNPNAKNYGAFENNSLIGLAVCVRNPRKKMKHFATINSIYTKPDYRGRGVATTLIQTIIEDCRKEGLEFLRLSVVTTNESAYKLYQKLGFIQYGVEKGSIKIDNNYYDQYLMQKILK